MIYQFTLETAGVVKAWLCDGLEQFDELLRSDVFVGFAGGEFIEGPIVGGIKQYSYCPDTYKGQDCRSESAISRKDIVWQPWFAALGLTPESIEQMTSDGKEVK